MGNNHGWVNSGSALSTAARSLTALGIPGGGGGGGLSGGTTSRAWSMPTGLGHGKDLILSSPNGSVHLGNAPAAIKNIDLTPFANGQALTLASGFDDLSPAPVAATDNCRDGVSMKVWLGSDSDAVGHGIINLNNVTELCWRFALKRRPATVWPGATAVDDFGSASSSKFGWAFIEDKNSNGGNGSGVGGNNTAPGGTGQGNDNDCILFNWAGSPGFKIDGNNLSDRLYLADYPVIDPKVHWDWNGWNYLTVWLYVDPAAPTTGTTKCLVTFSNANYYGEYFFPLLPQHSYTPTVNRPLFSGGVGTLHYWKYFNIQGYQGNPAPGHTTDIDVRFIDNSLHSGSGSIAGVYLHSKPNMYDPTGTAVHCPIKTWADGTCTVKQNLNNLNEANPIYCTVLPSTIPVNNIAGDVAVLGDTIARENFGQVGI